MIAVATAMSVAVTLALIRITFEAEGFAIAMVSSAGAIVRAVTAIVITRHCWCSYKTKKHKHN
jgi:ABC-type sulfate transport system permease component